MINMMMRFNVIIVGHVIGIVAIIVMKISLSLSTII